MLAAQASPTERILHAASVLERRGLLYLALGHTARALRAWRAADRIVFRALRKRPV